MQAQDQLDEIAVVAGQGDVDQRDGRHAGDIRRLQRLRSRHRRLSATATSSPSSTCRAACREDGARAARRRHQRSCRSTIRDANGARVIGLDFSGGTASVAAQLQSALGNGLAVTNPAGTTLRVMDDGAAGTTDMLSLQTRDDGDRAAERRPRLLRCSSTTTMPISPTALDGDGQKLGFAGRISVNQAIVQDNKLLVQYQVGGPLGDAERRQRAGRESRQHALCRRAGASGTAASFRLAGTVGDIISQTINFQGNAAATAIADNETQELTLDALSQRLESEYGVDVDEEMARLMELQNAFAANARVMSIVQELIQSLMQFGEVANAMTISRQDRCSRSSNGIKNIIGMKERYDKLQTQLSSGRRPRRLAEMGSDRYFDLALRQRMARMDGFQTVISTRRTCASKCSIQVDEPARHHRVRHARRDALGSAAAQSGINFQTTPTLAGSRFDEVMTLLNTDIAGRYMFGGNQTETPAGRGWADGAQRASAVAPVSTRWWSSAAMPISALAIMGRLTMTPPAAERRDAGRGRLADMPFGMKLSTVVGSNKSR